MTIQPRSSFTTAMTTAGAMLLSLVSAQEQAHAQTDSDAWKHEYSRSGVALYASPKADSGVNAYRAEVVLPYTTDEVIAILSDINRYKEFMPNTVESTVLKRTSKSEKHETALIYQRLNLPTIDDRDFVVQANTRKRPSSVGNFWTIDFEPGQNDVKPNDKSVVRVNVVSGRWVLTPIEGGKATHLTAIRHMELGGNVPNFMVNRGLRDGLYETLIELRKRCKSIIP